MSSMSTTGPFNTLSATQGDAWAAWNASYHEANGDVFRALGTALYMQDWRERIAAQLAKLDEQNALLDALLSARADRGTDRDAA